MNTFAFTLLRVQITVIFCTHILPATVLAELLSELKDCRISNEVLTSDLFLSENNYVRQARTTFEDPPPDMLLLEYDNTLAQSAATIARIGPDQFTDEEVIDGQLIYFLVNNEDTDLAIKRAVRLWTGLNIPVESKDGIANDYNDAARQVYCPNTELVGCALVQYDCKRFFIDTKVNKFVCKYSPPGCKLSIRKWLFGKKTFPCGEGYQACGIADYSNLCVRSPQS